MALGPIPERTASAPYTAFGANTGDELTESQLRDAQCLMDEMPRIDAALKTFLSMKMAEGMVVGSEGFADSVAKPASASVLTGCARVYLKAFNALQLPPAPEWSQRHPQGEEEQGMDFMARIGAYKVVYALWSRCSSAGQKPSKLLGRSPLKYAHAELVSQLLGQTPSAAATAGATEQQLRAFVDDFGRTIFDSESPGADVVWAVNLGTALAARQEVRKADAGERQKRASNAESCVEDMRAALMSQEESTVQIEEMED